MPSSTLGNVALALIAGVACSAPADAEPEANKASTITVQGSAQASAEPDQATLRVAVVTEAERSEAAAERNAATSNAVIAALKKAMGKKASIKTTGYSLSPQYDYIKATSSQRLRGYVARNSVELRTSDFARIGSAIDAATGAGANQIDSLVFGLEDDEPLRLEALASATRKAQAKAEAIARALDRRIERVVRVEEGGVGFTPVRMEADSFSRAKATPVEPGSVDVHASVSMQVELEE